MECVRVPFPHILINIYGIYSWWLPFWLKRGNLLSNFVLPLSWLLDILNILFMYTWIFVFHLLGSVCSVLIDWLSVLMMPSILSSVYTLVVNALSEQYFTKGVSYSEGSLLLLFILCLAVRPFKSKTKSCLFPCVCLWPLCSRIKWLCRF